MSRDERRANIEHWVGDYLEGAGTRDHQGVLREYAPEVLVAFLTAACAARDVEPADIDVQDLKPGLLDGVGRLEIPASVQPGIPALCGDFLADLETQGRLGGGRELGLRLRALKPAYIDAASGRGTPIVNPGAPLGRNDPCPCGSGKKYKKCCLNRLG